MKASISQFLSIICLTIAPIGIAWGDFTPMGEGLRRSNKQNNIAVEYELDKNPEQKRGLTLTLKNQSQPLPPLDLKYCHQFADAIFDSESKTVSVLCVHSYYLNFYRYEYVNELWKITTDLVLTEYDNRFTEKGSRLELTNPDLIEIVFPQSPNRPQQVTHRIRVTKDSHIFLNDKPADTFPDKFLSETAR